MDGGAAVRPSQRVDPRLAPGVVPGPGAAGVDQPDEAESQPSESDGAEPEPGGSGRAGAGLGTAAASARRRAVPAPRARLAGAGSASVAARRALAAHSPRSTWDGPGGSVRPGGSPSRWSWRRSGHRQYAAAAYWAGWARRCQWSRGRTAMRRSGVPPGPGGRSEWPGHAAIRRSCSPEPGARLAVLARLAPLASVGTSAVDVERSGAVPYLLDGQCQMCQTCGQCWGGAAGRVVPPRRLADPSTHRNCYDRSKSSPRTGPVDAAATHPYQKWQLVQLRLQSREV